MGSGVLSEYCWHNTVCHCINKCNLNLCYSRKKLYINSMQWCRGFSGPELISDSKKDSGNLCCVQKSSHFSLFLEKMYFDNKNQIRSPKDQRDHPDVHQRQMQTQTSVMVWGCMVWLVYVRCYHWHWGIYWDCTETPTAIKMTSFLGSPSLLDQDNAMSHTVCYYSVVL